jgi:alpha-glucosidase
MNVGMKRRVVLALLCFAGSAWAQEDVVSLKSPDGKIEIRLLEGPPIFAELAGFGHLTYQVDFKGKRLIDPSYMGFEIRDALPLGHKLGLVQVTRESNARFNEAVVDYLQNGSLGRRMTVEVRAFNEGIAFRYVVPFAAVFETLPIENELTQFVFAKDGSAYPQVLRGYQGGYAEGYIKQTLSGIHEDALIGLPFLVEQPGVGWAAVTEAGVEDFAGLFLQHQEGRAMRARLAPRVDGSKMSVLTKTPMASPWRVILIGERPEEFVESDIAASLNEPAKVDTSWVQPGKITDAREDNVDRRIEFAAASGFDYVLVDGVTQELVNRARGKKVGVWVAAPWRTVESQMELDFSRWEQWGVRGVKVTGMHRDDQDMVAFYRKVAAEAAKHKLMVAFEDAYKPDGLGRTFPNVMTRDAALTSKYAAEGARVTPEHNVMLAFSRVLAGPLDYAPGWFDNVTAEKFEVREKRPMVLGTRAHQLALFVIFASPLQTVADAPEAYAGQKEFDFIKAVPVTWDETRALDGKVGDFIVVARRKGEEWYVGAITGEDGREVSLPLSFLGSGEYTAEIYGDSGFTTNRVKATDKLTLKLAAGGGAAIRLHR